MPFLKKFNPYSSILILSFLFGCGDDSPSPNDSSEIEDNNTSILREAPQENKNMSGFGQDYPKVRIEELDHSQEFYKEQHTTSFSYVPRKNWTSFTASKNGLLTKILLFGKANLIDSPHYGLSMSGFVRANKPDSGPKYGRWSLSRDEIVSQLALQGLGERESGWLTIRMQGEIPQKVGTRYFLVCDKISESKAWFGEFSFAEANPYEFGSHWLNKEHDLVMRTYVGKTDEQIKSLQVDPSEDNPATVASDSLPFPISQNPQQSIIASPSPTPPNVPSLQEVTHPDVSVIKEGNKTSSSATIKDDENRSQKKSMFDRLFKKGKRE